MADLDDFFAKKDKKKKSKKFVTANTEVLATKLEEIDRREHQAEMKAVTAAMTTGEANFSKDNIKEGKDDDWKDYEEIKKDYTGLKIDALKLDADSSNAGDDDDTELNEDGEKVRSKKSDGGPWNKVAKEAGGGAEEHTPPSSPEPQHTEPQSAAAAVAGGAQKSAYVPPHLRGSAAAASPSSTPSSSGSKSQNRRKKAAPDINNEFNFPTLAAAVADTGATVKTSDRSESCFERVKSGGGQQHSRSAEAPKLALDNKFAALRDH